jgi:nucleotide-binding universal stress UspA family protein
MTKFNRYLLLIDGSAEALAAANVCRDLARLTGSSVVALHVINTPLLRRFLGFAKAGLVGSGPYVSAYEDMLTAARKLGETIIQAYQAEFADVVKHAKEPVLLREGNPFEVIQDLYLDFDLIVAGHRTLAVRDSESRSLCQALINDGARPLLLVQRDALMPERMRLILGDGVPATACLKSVLNFADEAALDKEFAWAGSAPGFDAYAPRISELVPLAETSAVYMTDVSHPLLDADWRPEISRVCESLPVFFTRKQLGGRVTLQNEDAVGLLSELDVATCLIWPGEYSRSDVTAKALLATGNQE